MKIISFDDLPQSDLIIDAIYEGGTGGNAGDDPISKLVPGIGNMGGFRHSGRGMEKKLLVLYTSGEDKDWPDTFDLELGRFFYYGDNRKPGHELHDTPRGGNDILRTIFMQLHSDDDSYTRIPPILFFEKHPTENSARSVRFRGLLVPGAPGVSATEDLVALWRSKEGRRFQNYYATFTILDAAVVSRQWLQSIVNGLSDDSLAPESWREWKKSKKYSPLYAKPTVEIRTKEEQLPSDENGSKILNAVYRHFESDPRAFEFFAAEIYRLSDSRVTIDEITQVSVDGGRDAIGRYRLGLNSDPVYVDFALEAKCYRPGVDGTNTVTVGVKETSRLVSRLLHRQFGVLVTTSVVAKQAYSEVRGDKHPIVFIVGKDIVDILVHNGFSTEKSVVEYLSKYFPTKRRTET